LEELVPKAKESTGLRDQPDPMAEEAPASERSSRRWRWREKGVGVEERLKEQFTPTPLLLYG
jgi:hypothetical protein